MLHYFEDIFCSSQSDGGEEVLNSVRNRVTPEMRAQLDMSFSEEAIKVAVFQMQPSNDPD